MLSAASKTLLGQLSSQTVLFAVQAKENDEDLPPWVRTERARELAAQADGLPFGVYLLGAAIVSIAAVWPTSAYCCGALFGASAPAALGGSYHALAMLARAVLRLSKGFASQSNTTKHCQAK